MYHNIEEKDIRALRGIAPGRVLAGAEIGDMLALLYTIPDPAAAWENVSPGDYLYCLNTDDGRVLIIEAVCNIIVQMLNEAGVSDLQDNFLQNHIGTILAKI